MSIRPLPKDLQMVAQNELNEKPNKVQENILIIKEWVTKEPHLNARTDDQWILTYLRGCKHSIQLTKEKIDYYYQLRTIAPELFGNRDPLAPAVQEVFTKQLIVPLEVNKHGPQSFLCRFGAKETDHISLITLMKVSIMIYDILLNENDYLMMGISVIWDLKNMNLSKLFELTLNQIKLWISLQNAYPCRVKSIIVLNAPTPAKSALELIKMLLGKKIGNRMHFCTGDNLEQLCKYVPPLILPQEYGGEACTNKILDYWKSKLKSYQDWFLQDALFGSDETKRINRNLSHDYFGADGSFKKLEID